MSTDDDLWNIIISLQEEQDPLEATSLIDALGILLADEAILVLLVRLLDSLQDDSIRRDAAKGLVLITPVVLYPSLKRIAELSLDGHKSLAMLENARKIVRKSDVGPYFVV